MLIFVMGFELLTSSFNAITNPEATELNTVALIILIFSVFVKLYMFFYNRACGTKINSAAMKATASDSLGDAAATTAVLVSLIVSKMTGWLIDGYMGILVALFILFAGYRAAKETIEPLLGLRPEKELIDELEKTVLSYEPIEGVHDVILHDYGPGRRFLSLHAEVPMDCDILFVHDVIDNIEIEIYNKFGIETVIHMDPINTKDERINCIKAEVTRLLRGLNEDMKSHDYRIVPGNTHTNVLFDIVIPADSKTDAEAVKLAVSTAVTAIDPLYRCVIKIDRDYS
jgi:cation diffusion facilitator family transporter